ncbi:MAG: universal stress protein [Elusimicrobia bacterium]|nr:universal stress protein [Elusimicrobiota bacterium]MDE2237938.1 universal stress protein [Elusimicrobiota bacterium]MDE2425966.1 universal stress protein [Elusimicrobiota bacterium]
MTTQTQASKEAMVTAPAERILCAVDLRRRSVAALCAARALAERWSARLELLCAADIPAFLNQNEGTQEERRQLDDFRRRLQMRMQTFAGTDLPCWVRDGPADEAIVEAARERSCGLIAMGTHGRSGISRAVLGSTAEAVIAETGVPVLVVPRWSDGGWPRKVLVPMKFTDYADRALLYADAFARSVKASLGVLHVAESALEEQSAHELRRHVEELTAGSALFIAQHSRYEPAEAILREAELGGYDLIVMAAHRKPFWREWRFGMTVQRLLRYSSLPVLSVGTAGRPEPGTP